jgi:3-hydroxyisobutyrate dehydrogenase-like beta-hydroxyacid dehydrogenase
MAKDLAVATAEAAMAGVELPMSAAATTSHAAAVAAGLGDLDCAAIATGLAGAPEPRGGDR